MTRSPIFAHAADLYREMRREFDVVLEAAYAAAEEGTGGSLLNTAGRAAPVDAYSLLMGPWSRVLKYGSPELIEWFEMHGRPSVAEFEREWFRARQEPDDTAGHLGPLENHGPECSCLIRCYAPAHHSQPCSCAEAIPYDAVPWNRGA